MSKNDSYMRDILEVQIIYITFKNQLLLLHSEWVLRWKAALEINRSLCHDIVVT